MKVCRLPSRHSDSEPVTLSNRVSQGTCAEGVIRELFVGTVKSFIKSANVNYASTIEEFKGEKQTQPRGN